MVAQVGYSMAGRSGGRVTPCEVCTVHVETMSAGFLVEPQNQGRQFVSGLVTNRWNGFLRFGLKTGGDSFLRFGPQNRQLRFDDLGLKITATVSCFGTQNQAGYGLSVAPQN
jgi:hypothetical protein